MRSAAGDLVVPGFEVDHARDVLVRHCFSPGDGLFCGIYSWVNVFAAIQLTKQMEKGSRVVTVLPGRRDRYFAEYPHEHYVV